MQRTTDDIANLLWGIPAQEAVEEVPACDDTTDPPCDPPVEGQPAVPARDAVEGVVDKVRKADEKLSEAYQSQNAADQALFENQNGDEEHVTSLVNALRDAQENVIDRELKLTRVREYENLLYQEFDAQNQRNEERIRQEIAAEVEQAQEELKELKGFFETAEEAKNDWITQDERLRRIVESMNSAESTATEEEKNEAQSNLDAHQDNK